MAKVESEKGHSCIAIGMAYFSAQSRFYGVNSERTARACSAVSVPPPPAPKALASPHSNMPVLPQAAPPPSAGERSLGQQQYSARRSSPVAVPAGPAARKSAAVAFDESALSSKSAAARGSAAPRARAVRADEAPKTTKKKAAQSVGGLPETKRSRARALGSPARQLEGAIDADALLRSSSPEANG